MLTKEAFVPLIERASGRMYRVARAILRNDEDCKDALQETALKAWQKRDSLRDLSLFETWLTRIVINECHTLLRKQRKYVLRDDMEDGRSSPAPDPALQMALESLPEKWRLPLVLHYLEGYDYGEVASLLRLPESTVRSRLSRARKTLREQMEDEKEAWLHERA